MGESTYLGLAAWTDYEPFVLLVDSLRYHPLCQSEVVAPAYLWYNVFSVEEATGGNRVWLFMRVKDAKAVKNDFGATCAVVFDS